LEIKVNISAPELTDAINKLAEAIASNPTSQQVEAPAPKPAKKTNKKDTKPAEPVKEEEKTVWENPPEADDFLSDEPEKKEEPKYTKEQVREKCTIVSRAGKQTAVKTAISEITGIAVDKVKFSDVKPEQYNALMEKIEKI
jgi:hypothetical protein